MVTHELPHSLTHRHTQACTHSPKHTHTKSQEGGHNAVLPSSFLQRCMFFFSLSPRLPGRGTLPFVSKGTLSLSFPLLFSLSLIHGAQKARERARRSLSPGQGGPRGGLTNKRAKRERGRNRKEEITRQKRAMRLCICVPMFCALFRSLRFEGE